MAFMRNTLTFTWIFILHLWRRSHCQAHSTFDPTFELNYLLKNRSEIAYCQSRHESSSLNSDTCYNTPVTAYGGDFMKDDIPTPTDISIKDELKFYSKNCFCDKFCLKYGDCCVDVAQRHEQWNHVDKKWVCSQLFGSQKNIRSIYTIGKCGLNWKNRDDDIKSRCEMHSSLGAYYVQYIPVVSRTTENFYRNIFCAICNDDSDDIEQWEFAIKCTSSVPVKELISEGSLRDDNFDAKSGSWVIPDEYGISFNCYLHISEFQNSSVEFASKYNVRACKVLIDSCAQTDNEDAIRCKLYSSFLYADDESVYRNSYCAKCNNVSLSKLECTLKASVQSRINYHASLSVLFDFNVKSGGVVSRTRLCKAGSIYDSLRQRCILVQCGRLYRLQDGKCIRDEEIANATNSLHSSCFTIRLLPGEYNLLPNGTVWVNYTKRTYEIGEYELTNPSNLSHSELTICKEEHLVPLFKFSAAQSILSQVCLYISIFCLIVHIILYAIVPKLRNLPGKNLLCLSCSLLLGQLFFLFGVSSTGSRPSCVFIGIALHFFFLSYFFWMNVMAIDICYTFRSNSYCPNAGIKTFIKYSCYAWLVPVGIVILSVTFDNIDDMELSFRPGYGSKLCWINHKKALILFFIVPIAIIMVMNIIMFSLTAVHIKKSNEASKRAIKRSEKMRYLLYIKLAIIMGLTWLFAFLAAFVESEATWYLYIVLNGLQGAFIFIAFSCKRKVFKVAIDTFSSKITTETSTSSKDKKTFTTYLTSNNSADNLDHSGARHRASNSELPMRDSTLQVKASNNSSNSESNV